MIEKVKDLVEKLQEFDQEMFVSVFVEQESVDLSIQKVYEAEWSQAKYLVIEV